MRRLWRRKVRIGRSRGQAEVIGAVFFVIITFLLSTNVFLWSISKHNQYNEVVVQCNQRNTEASNERIAIIAGNYTLSPSHVTVNVTLLNEGSVPTQIVTLWVVDENLNSYNVTSLRSSNINLNPGNTGQVIKDLEIAGCQSDHVYDIWLVTARGSIISFRTQHFLTVVQMVQAIGPIAVVFKSMYWTSIDHPAGGTYRIPKGEDDVTWTIEVTNYGDNDITLTTSSTFTLWGLTGGQTSIWNLGANTTVPVGKSVTLTFNVGEPVPTNIGVYPVIVTLMGYYGSDPAAHFGETIPFEAAQVVTSYP